MSRLTSVLTSGKARLASPRARLVGLVTLVGLAASACASNAQQTTLEPQGPAADKINNLSNATFIIAGVVFVVVEVGVLYVVLNLVIDLLYARIDPRIRLGGKVGA